MDEWVGSAIGSASGLIAILLGALYNAKLTRDRDERLSKERSRSTAHAICAELTAALMVLADRRDYLASPASHSHISPYRHDLRLKLPDIPIAKSVLDEVPNLPPDVSQSVVLSMHSYEMCRQILDVRASEFRNEDFSGSEFTRRYIYESMKTLLDSLEKAADSVGKPEYVTYAYDQLPELMSKQRT